MPVERNSLLRKTIAKLRHMSAWRLLALIVAEMCAVLFLLRPGLFLPDNRFEFQTRFQTAERWATTIPVAITLVTAVTLLTLLVSRRNLHLALNSLGYCLVGLFLSIPFLLMVSVVNDGHRFEGYVQLMVLFSTFVIIGWVSGLLVIRARNRLRPEGPNFRFSLTMLFCIVVAAGLFFSLLRLFEKLREWPTW